MSLVKQVESRKAKLKRDILAIKRDEKKLNDRLAAVSSELAQLGGDPWFYLKE